MRRTDALIVGGGPAGAAAAIVLARAGRAPLILERGHAAGAIVCGGFLGWDALASLDALGIDAFALGARPIDRVRIVAGGRVVEARLPRRAAGLSRDALDAALLAEAGRHGATIEQAIVRGVDGTVAQLGDGTAITADALFLATGKHNLRGAAREGAGEGAIGLRRSIAAPAGLDGLIELHLFRGGYAGLLLQEDGTANLCLSASARRLRESGGSAATLLAALAGEAPRLVERAPGDGAWASIAAVPYGWRAAATAPGRYRVGDQAAVIASLVGDGVAIALASGRMAAEGLLRGEAAPDFQRRFAARAARPLGIAETMRHIAEHPSRTRALLPWLGRLPGALGLVSRLTRIGH